LNQYPELTGVGNNFVLACQALGLGLVASMICLIALLIFTSLGNEHRQVYARVAAFGLILGFALLMLAPVFAKVLIRIFPLVSPS
jgi:hypothetical protein